MWSHYGDQHHGVALGFDVSDEYAMKVTYRDELNRLDEVLLATSKDKQIDVLQRVFATKFTNWKYELEVRLFTEIRNSDEASGHFFKAFDSGLLLKEVIFGARYQNPEEMAALLPKIRNDREITCWKAALGNETFKLIVDPDWQQYR